MKVAALAIFLALLVPPVSAQGIDVFERLDLNDFDATVGSGARAWGMGGAFVAVADDGTAASWNPAGLSILQAPEITVVLVPTDRGSFDYQGDVERLVSASITTVVDFTGFATRSTGSYLDYLSYAHPVEGKRFGFVPQIGYQRAITRSFDLLQRTPAALSVHRQGSFESFTRVEQETHSDGGFDVLSAALAVRLDTTFSLGISLNYWRLDTERTDEQRVDAVFPGTGDVVLDTRERSTQSDQSGSGFNANLGLMWRPIPALAVGAVYKTAFDLDVDIEKVVVDTNNGSAQRRSTSSSGSISWPETMAAGVSWHPVDPLRLSFDVTRSGWSDAVLKLDGGGQEAFPGGSGVDSQQEDTQQIRLGGEYAFPGSVEGAAFPFRFGVFQDRQILRDARGQAVNVLGVTLGVGVTMKHWIFDLAVVRSDSSAYRTAPADQPHGDGNLETERNRVFFSGIYRFAGKAKKES